MDYWQITVCMLLASAALAGEPVVFKCDPQILHGVPGEPLRTELTVESPDAVPARVVIPSVSNLVLRTVEKIPIQRTKDGRFVQKRVIIWQGVEAGSAIVTNLSVQLGAATQFLPTLEITVDAVEPAAPPSKGEAK